MSAKLKLNNNVGGSTSLVCDDSQTQDLELKVFSNDIASRVLSGTELTAVGIVGANPQATLWANGDITGSSDNGNFTKSANGDLECVGGSAIQTMSSVLGSVFGTNASVSPFPIVFTVTPRIALGAQSGDGSPWCGVYAPTTSTQCYPRLYNYESGKTGYSIYTAIGRWK